MTDTDIESPPVYVALGHPQKWNPDTLVWAATSPIQGARSQIFLKTLHRDHYPIGVISGKRKGISKRARCVSKLAIEVWQDPELRAQWLTYHKAISRLVPNS
jgi:hypothetical protein